MNHKQSPKSNPSAPPNGKFTAAGYQAALDLAKAITGKNALSREIVARASGASHKLFVKVLRAWASSADPVAALNAFVQSGG